MMDHSGNYPPKSTMTHCHERKDKVSVYTSSKQRGILSHDSGET